MKPGEPWLNLNGIYYSLDQLKLEILKNDLNPFEQRTLSFCHSWLTGQQTFQLQTSGSTGAPKNITITRQQMEVSARLTIKALRLESNYSALICLDTKYIAGQMMLVRCLLLGMNIVAIDPTSNPFDKIPTTLSIDFAALVPYQLQGILSSSSRTRLNELSCAIIGGAAIDQSVKKELQSFACRFYATYGMTETISHIALQQLNTVEQEYFKVFDEIEINKDERGCLVISAGYLGSERIVTNDLVNIMDTHKFRWLGRWDNVINSGGVKIIPEKIESVIHDLFDSLKLTNRFFVAGLPDDKLSQKASLIIEGSPFAKDLLARVEKELGEKVDRYEKPREIKFIKRFKETETGKVIRAETLRLISASSH